MGTKLVSGYVAELRTTVRAATPAYGEPGTTIQYTRRYYYLIQPFPNEIPKFSVVTIDNINIFRDLADTPALARDSWHDQKIPVRVPQHGTVPVLDHIRLIFRTIDSTGSWYLSFHSSGRTRPPDLLYILIRLYMYRYQGSIKG